MVAPPMHGSKLDKIIAELFFIEISCFLFLLNNFSQIFDLADQLGRVSSGGSSSSGHHTCHSIGCTKVWLCWVMVSLKSFLLNIQRPFLKVQFRSYIYVRYQEYIRLPSSLQLVLLYGNIQVLKTKFPIFTTSSNICKIFTQPDMIFVQNFTLPDFQAKKFTP